MAWKKTVKEYWSAILVVLLVPCVLFLASTAIVAHTAPLMHSLLDSYSQNPKDAKIALDYYYTYIISWDQEPPIIEGMTAGELQHLRDVKFVWWRGLIALGVSLFLLILLMVHARKKKRLWPALEWGALITIVLMVIAALVPFADLWRWLHTLTFKEGSWVFSYGSRIITLFPPTFFEAVTLRIGVVALFLAFITYAAAFIGKKLHARKMKAAQSMA